MKTKNLVLLLLAFSSVSIAQTTLANKLKITANTTDNTATKVNVQNALGEINTIEKADLVDVIEKINYASLPVTGIAGKIYVTTSTNKIYRWNGTSYGELAVTDISGKVDKVTGKSLILDSEITRLASIANQDISVKEDKSNKAIANGYASLDNNGKVPLNQVNDALLGAVNYKGTYNAATNTPTLPAVSSSNKGWYYVVDTDGTSQSITFKAGDWIISNGTAWGRVDNNNAVASVNSKVGAVTLTKSDIGLSNVDNTTDLLKPISTATQTALDLKVSSTATNGYIPIISGTTLANSSISENTSYVITPKNLITNTVYFGKGNGSGTFNIVAGNGNTGVAQTTGGSSLILGAESLRYATYVNNSIVLGRASAQVSSTSVQVTSLQDGIFLGAYSYPLSDTSTNEIVIAKDGRGLGSNTTAIGNSSTTFARLWGRNLINTSIDNLVDQLQVAGSSLMTGLTVNSTTKGVLLPRMTTTQKNAISSPIEGMELYDTTLKKKAVYTGSAWESIGGSSLPYKVYTALLTQSGTSAPVATVLENNTGSTVVWTRGSIGQYLGTFSSPILLIGKTAVFPIQAAAPYINHAAVSRNSDSTISLITTSSGSNSDDKLYASSLIEIRVYN